VWNYFLCYNNEFIKYAIFALFSDTWFRYVAFGLKNTVAHRGYRLAFPGAVESEPVCCLTRTRLQIKVSVRICLAQRLLTKRRICGTSLWNYNYSPSYRKVSYWEWLKLQYIRPCKRCTLNSKVGRLCWSHSRSGYRDGESSHWTCPEHNLCTCKLSSALASYNRNVAYTDTLVCWEFVPLIASLYEASLFRDLTCLFEYSWQFWWTLFNGT
jgi:hypothetical protein